MTRVKVCGLTNEPDLRAAVEAGADAVGVIADVDVDTPREVAPGTAAELVAAAPPFVTTVLVTMPAAPDRALELVREVRPDAVQVHGDVPTGDLAYLAARTEAAVVRAVGADEPALAREQDAVADALLVDAPSADGGGGTGHTHDWDAVATLAADLDSPVVLAGGLTPDNVGDAVHAADPYAVDVASGVEASGGEKNHDAVRAFVRAARGERVSP
jgi:phosphoribosylanthranilate isomerase